MGTAPPAVLFTVLLGVALIGITHGSWRGHWLTVALHAVTMTVAIWGLRLPHQQNARGERLTAATGSTVRVSGTHPDPSPQHVSSPNRPEPSPYETPTHSTTTEGLPEIPAVDSFAITGRTHRTVTGVTGHLTVVLPVNIEVAATPVVNALLTAGHRILHEHRLTHQPLPAIEVTGVDRAEKPSTPTPAHGFTVDVTNNLTTCHSHITIEAPSSMNTEEGALLIAATLLAGAEHLLERPDRTLHLRTPTTRGRATTTADRHTPPAPR